MRNTAVLVACLLLLAGCRSKARKFFDGGGYQAQMREDEAARNKAEKEQWTRDCVSLFEEREAQLAEVARELEARPMQSEEDVKQANKDWQTAYEKALADVPYQCSHEPQNQRRQTFRETVQGEKKRFKRVLLKKAGGANAPRWARTILFSEFNTDVNTRDVELEQLAATINGEQYDAWLLNAFKTHGGYGRMGPVPDKVGVVFSSEPWPEELGEVEPRFTTHFTGRGKLVYVLARLPLPARRYAKSGAALYLQLLSDNGYSIDLAHSFEVGTPEGVGDTPYIRGVFELPPERWKAHTRYWFDVRALLTWEAGEKTKARVLSQSSFSWVAEE